MGLVRTLIASWIEADMEVRQKRSLRLRAIEETSATFDGRRVLDAADGFFGHDEVRTLTQTC
jgi:hypothetical protein